ncbi:MAG: MmgE/PrpD family protein [Proteobacteria bacterium]|nr:MmgE/PrpD family protein [Pseudomonadota bacterium]
MSLQPTPALAQFVLQSLPEQMSEKLAHEAKRAILNWVGCAVGASQHATVQHAITALSPFFGQSQASVLGRRERPDILHAALLNGITSHTFDFDDTHLKTVIHPAGPVASALIALAEHHPISGREFLHAFALGVEVECRIGNAVYPSHYDVGWHITGTAGVFGAAAAAGKVLKLSQQQLVWALGIAATQACGLREMFGSMCKPLHPGLAAKNGLYAALLAQQDFTSSEQGIEGKRGFANVLASERDFGRITEGLGETWELLENTYKPFACGIVIHPVIDGCIQLRSEHALQAAEIVAIHLRVHPLVLELTGKTAPRVGLEGKFSVYHSAAAAIIDGAAGEAQYSDEKVMDPEWIALRNKVQAVADATLKEDAAHIAITCSDGKVLNKHIAHTIGSLARPMSDRDLEEKFSRLCAPHLPKERSDALISAIWALDSRGDAGQLAQMTVPDA